MCRARDSAGVRRGSAGNRCIQDTRRADAARVARLHPGVGAVSVELRAAVLPLAGFSIQVGTGTAYAIALPFLYQRLRFYGEPRQGWRGVSFDPPARTRSDILGKPCRTVCRTPA